MRGFPNGIFNPWARWNTWLGLGQEFFRRRRRRRRRRRPPKMWKNTKEILDESYLEQRYECSSFAVALRISLRFFLAIQQKVRYSVKSSRAKLGGPGPARAQSLHIFKDT